MTAPLVFCLASATGPACGGRSRRVFGRAAFVTMGDSHQCPKCLKATAPTEQLDLPLERPTNLSRSESQ